MKLKSKSIVISRVAEVTTSSSPHRGNPSICLLPKRQMWRLATEFVWKRDCSLGPSASEQFSNSSIPCPAKADSDLDLCLQGQHAFAHNDICKRYA